MLDLIDLDDDAKAAFAQYLPDLRFVLDDLTAQGERQIRQLAELFAALPQDRAGTETLAAVVCYLLEVADPEPDQEQLRRFFASHVGQNAAEVAMSAAGKLRQEGRVEGRAEGEAKGRAAVLLSLLTLKFGAASAATRKRVESASIEELDAFAARVLSANDVRDVLDPSPAKPRRSSKKAPKKRR